MTNQAIMAAYRTAHNIADDAPLYTYAVWRQKGYTVKKGEAARHRVTLYKYATKTDENGTKTSRIFPKTAYLFEFSQVEKIK